MIKYSEGYQVWACKIGIKGGVKLPPGSDYPMREAVQTAFKELTGVDADFCFSGWGAKLTRIEREVIKENPSETYVIGGTGSGSGYKS